MLLSAAVHDHEEEVGATQGEGNQEGVETESEEEEENVSRLLKLYLVCSSQSWNMFLMFFYW